MAVALAQHPVGDPGVDEQPDAVLLEDARADGLLDLAVGADVDDHRVDPGQGQQVGEHQAQQCHLNEAARRANHSTTYCYKDGEIQHFKLR